MQSTSASELENQSCARARGGGGGGGNLALAALLLYTGRLVKLLGRCLPSFGALSFWQECEVRGTLPCLQGQQSYLVGALGSPSTCMQGYIGNPPHTDCGRPD